MLPISFPLSKNPQAGSIRFFSLHPRAKLRLSVIFFFYLIIGDFSVLDSSFLSPPSRLIVFLYKMYKMLLSDFLSLPLLRMNTSSPCFSNTSYPIHLSSFLSQRLLQSQANPRIIGLDQSLPWGFIAILHKYLRNKEMCAEGRFTRWKTESLSRFPKIPISHRNTFVPYSFFVLSSTHLSRLTQLVLSQEGKHRTDSCAHVCLYSSLYQFMQTFRYLENYRNNGSPFVFHLRVPVSYVN